MANNQYVNKVVYDSNVLIDLTSDTIAPEYILKNYTAHDKSGAPITGSCEYDSKTTDANAVASEILSGKTAYVNKNKITGNMTNNGSNNITVTGKTGTSIPAGYYDGSGKALLDSISATNLIATNIRSGITILGVEGTLNAEDGLTVGAISITPQSSQQVVTAASESLDYITQVTVAAIPYTESDNAQGGKTVTIGAAA